MAGLAPKPAMLAFAVVLVLTLAAGAQLWRTGHGARLFGVLSAAQFVVAIAAVIAFLSLYVYEHPHHHCPFCLLKAEFDHIGYALYAPLFAATGYGLAAAIQQAHAHRASLAGVLPARARRHTGLALLNLIAFALLSGWIVLGSNLRLIAP
jgi:hypothetical protein